MRPLAAALQFLTRLPLARLHTTDADRRRAAYWFGAAGLGIGGAAALAEWALRPAMPLVPRLVCALIVNAALTGGLHLDGLADTADALGGGSRERALEIMRDSRIGSFGALALLGALGLQLSALAQLGPAAVTRALVLGPAWGRAGMVMAAAMGHPARREGLGTSFMQGIGAWAAVAAFTPVVAVAVGWGGRSGLLGGAAAVALAAGMTAWFRRRFGGQTGDTLGCINTVIETATYCLFLVTA